KLAQTVTHTGRQQKAARSSPLQRPGGLIVLQGSGRAGRRLFLARLACGLAARRFAGGLGAVALRRVGLFRFARIGNIPAGTLKDDADRVEQARDRSLALRAGGNRIVFHALENLKLILTLRTLISVGGHFLTSPAIELDASASVQFIL